MKGTTVIAVKREGKVAIGGDGQITAGNTIIKKNATKIRRIADGKIVLGFAGATADAMTLFERLEGKLERYNKLQRAAIELAKEWRTDKVLRRLEAMMIAADSETILLISGNGDVIEPEDGIIAIGSGAPFATAAARALAQNTEMPAKEIVEKSLKITADICVYTSDKLVIEEI